MHLSVNILKKMVAKMFSTNLEMAHNLKTLKYRKIFKQISKK
jgi:hypothetical protein